jgi:uncharacterized protein (TIGR03083 family)
MGCGFGDAAATTRSGPRSAFTKRPGEPTVGLDTTKGKGAPAVLLELRSPQLDRFPTWLLIRSQSWGSNPTGGIISVVPRLPLDLASKRSGLCPDQIGAVRIADRPIVVAQAPPGAPTMVLSTERLRSRQRRADASSHAYCRRSNTVHVVRMPAASPLSASWHPVQEQRGPPILASVPGVDSVAPPEEPPFEVVELVSIERSRLLVLLRTLGPEEWAKPSPCPGWTILDLAAHLLGDDFHFIAVNRDRHRGTEPPDGLTETQFVAWLDSLQDGWVREARRLSPRLVIDLLTWTAPRLIDTFKTQDPTARVAHVSWAGPEKVTVWLDQVRELSEYWIHRQQLRQGLGLGSDLRPDLAGPVLDGLRWAYPFRLRQAPRTAGETITITITGPVSVTWHLVATRAGWEFRNERGSNQVAQMTASTEHMWRLLTNNLARDDYNQVDLTGDRTLTEIILHTRAIIGMPK